MERTPGRLLIIWILLLTVHCGADQAVCDVLSFAQAFWLRRGKENPAYFGVDGDGEPLMANTSDPADLSDLARRERWFGWKHHKELMESPGAMEVARKVKSGDEGVNFFKAAAPREWVILGVVSICLCLMDTFFMQLFPKTFVWHLAVVVIWMAVAAFYLWGVTARLGSHAGIEWFSGYVLEWMLSMDNLFVFHLVFKSYKTPQDQVHKAVFVGIIGAVLMRLIFFMVVSTLLHAFGWFRWPFGALLVWSGVQAIRGEEDDDTDVQDTFLVRWLKSLLGSRLSDIYSSKGANLLVFDAAGRLQMSVLFVVILVIEFSDVVFALDSVSAKTAQIPNQYLAFSSSVLAMYGLRAMFFVVENLVSMFDLLNYGLGLILVFIGVELMFGHWINLSSGVECAIIVAVFVLCIAASGVKMYVWPSETDDEEEKEGKEEKNGAKSSERKSTADEASDGHNITSDPGTTSESDAGNLQVIKSRHART